MLMVFIRETNNQRKQHQLAYLRVFNIKWKERFISRLHSDSFGYLKFAWKFSFSYSIIEKLFFDHIHFHTKTLWLKLHYQLQGIWMLERKCTGHVHNDKFRLRMFTQIEMRYSKDKEFKTLWKSRRSKKIPPRLIP